MKKEKGLEIFVIAVLSIAVIAMSMGFAAYSTTLNINGTATVDKASWSVHFQEGSVANVAKGGAAVADTAPSLSTTLVEYTVELTKPGDSYSFDVTVVNDGTIDATLKSITLGGVSAEQAKYVTYTVTYAGTAYNATTTGLSQKLAASGTATVNVKVSYEMPSESSDLPSANQTLNLTCALLYEAE